jgi:hypothetical protein
MERDGELRVSVAVHRCDRLDQRSEIRLPADPVGNRGLDGTTKPAPAMPKQSDEKILATAEVVVDARIGDADPLGHRPHLNRPGTAFDEQLLGGLEDPLLGLFGRPANSLLRHIEDSTLTMQGKIRYLGIPR